jgi:hypothetical protein
MCLVVKFLLGEMGGCASLLCYEMTFDKKLLYCFLDICSNMNDIVSGLSSKFYKHSTR